MVSNPAVSKKDMQKEHPVYTKPCMMHSKEKFLFLHFILQDVNSFLCRNLHSSLMFSDKIESILMLKLYPVK